MLLIPCPWCGPRNQTEFRCGGQAHLVRPEPFDAVTDETWADYLFTRDNLKGRNRERWVHQHGCRLWFNLVRDTVTHEIVQTYEMGSPPQEPGETGQPDQPQIDRRRL